MTTRTNSQAPAGTLPRPDAVTMAAFTGVVLIAGANPVAVRFSNRELDPIWGASLRFAGATLLLFAIAAFMRLPLPRGTALVGALLYGLTGIFAAYACMYIGLVRAPATLAAPIMASVPLMTFFLAIAHRLERFRWRGLAGGAVSLAGIVVLTGSRGASGAPLRYVLFVVMGAAFAAEAGVIVKRFPRVHPIMLNAVALAGGTVLLLAMSFIRGESHVLPQRAQTWVALGFLALLGSTLLFVLFVTVVTRWTVSGASYQFVLFPLVSVLLATLIANEPVSETLAAGAALVLAGVYVGALSGGHHLHREPEPAAIPEPAPTPPC